MDSKFKFYLFCISLEQESGPIRTSNTDKSHAHGFLRMPNIKLFQAEHALYTPGLDDNCGSSDFVHNIWICCKLQGTFCTLHSNFTN